MSSHKQDAPKNVAVGVISVSSTRSADTDESGKWICRLAAAEGHQVVFYQVVPDDAGIISEIVTGAIRSKSPNVLILTGGTGISRKDVTIEAVQPLFEKELTAFGPIFAQLSFEEIDSAAILSRATAGLVQQTLVFCIPGSLKACKLACGELIFPELGHLTKHASE